MRSGVDPRTGKTRMRWTRAFYVDRCAVHDGASIGPNGQGYVEANGWDCGGCRWESGEGDDWALPPISICNACFAMAPGGTKECRVCWSSSMSDIP